MHIVPEEGFEPSRLLALVPKTSVSTVPPFWHFVLPIGIEPSLPPCQDAVLAVTPWEHLSNQGRTRTYIELTNRVFR